MFSAKLVCITISVCLSALINLGCAQENSGVDAVPSPPACTDCRTCQYPCQPLTPPASGYPSYEAAPSPPPPSAIPGYPADVLPPPKQPGQGNCLPTPVQCCQYYTPPPPPGVYLPYNYNHALPCSLPSFLYVIMMLLFASSVTF